MHGNPSRPAEKASTINRLQDIANGGLKALLLENRPAFLRYLFARRVAPDEAEDLLQDLFVKLEVLRLGPIAEPRAYLYSMLDNLLLDRRRASGRRSGREQAWTVTYAGTSDIDDGPSPEEALISRDRLQKVSAALGQLPERTLVIFRRFRLDDIPQRQIAEELGISVSAIEKHLQRAYNVVLQIRARLDADVDARRRP